SDSDRPPDGEGLSAELPRALHRSNWKAGRLRGWPFQGDVVHGAGGSGFATPDRVQQRGEFNAGAGDDARKGVRIACSAGSRTCETGAASDGREPTPGDGRGHAGDIPLLGWPEIAGCGYATKPYTSRNAD